MIDEEQKIQQKLLLIDSNAAKEIFNGNFEKYAVFTEKFEQKAQKIVQKGFGNYIPYLDTLKTSLRFLSSESLTKSTATKNKIQSALDNVDDLKNRFDQVRQLQEYIKQRKAYLQQQLGKFGMVKDLKKLNKELFYYSQTIKSYKDILCDPKKIEKAALSALKKLPQFQDFLKRNSQLATFLEVIQVP